MTYVDYSDIANYIFDKELIRLLCFDRKFGTLLDAFAEDDFLAVKPDMKIPFFAEIRDYKTAVEKSNPDAQWLVKPVEGKEALKTEMAMIVYFLDMYTKTISVPVIITKIKNRIYKATKTISHAEQLSGANYTVIPELIEPLLLDMINRWIYCDEDRNPNNYMLKYNSINRGLVLAIDFGNADLLYKQIKIRGVSNSFGWEKKEKTRYLTPLKSNSFLKYDMQFYHQRFLHFNKLNRSILLTIARKALRFHAEREELAKTIATNILRRRDYVYRYFQANIPHTLEVQNQYKDMGKSFQKFYG